MSGDAVIFYRHFLCLMEKMHDERHKQGLAIKCKL